MTDPAIQKTMVKNVKIHAPIAIKTVVPTIYGDIEKTAMNPANILKCLIGRATVWEIMPDGSLLKLNEHNYNTINKPAVKVVNKEQKLAKDVDHSAPEVVEDGTKFKTMILKDAVGFDEKVDIAPGTVENLNDKLKEVGEIPAPKFDDGPAEKDVATDDSCDDHKMTAEEKELAEIQAQIDALDADEKSKNGKKNKK